MTSDPGLPAGKNNIFQTYIEQIQRFRRNARLYLVYMLFMGVGMGVFRLLFNYYILSLGYNEAILGNLITINNMTSLLAAIPMGYLADRVGRKRALMLAAFLFSASIMVMVAWPGTLVFILFNITLGLGMSLSTVTQSPFLMENSGEEERTYLFSLSFGMRMTAMFVGNWVGGYLPTWLGAWRGEGPESSTAYGLALGVMSVIVLLGLLPLSRMRRYYQGREEELSLFLPLSYLRDHLSTFGKLILPLLVTSFGAGLFMPFMNVFFREVHHQSDQSVGTLFAWGALAMGVGLVIAPIFADRFGKIRVVVLTQALSIPFLFMLGYSPWYWMAALAYYVRLTTMNMSNPIYQTFVMEHVEPEARATAASLVSMAWSFGRAFSPTISGYLQVEYGFDPVFAIVIGLYSVSVFLYWYFFWRDARSETPVYAGD